MSRAPIPHSRAVSPEEGIQIEAMFGARVHISAEEVPEGVEAGIKREEDSVSEGGIGGETRVLEHALVEVKLKEVRIGAEPAPGGVVGPDSKTMVGFVIAELVGAIR